MLYQSIMVDINKHKKKNIKTKIRTYGDKVYTKFRGLNVPEGDIECKSFTFISIDSLLVYEKKNITASTFRQLRLQNYKPENDRLS